MNFLQLMQERNYTPFLEPSFDATQVDERGRTALHLAAFLGRDALARYLVVRQGADPDAKTPQGLSPVDYAVFQGHSQLAMFLVTERASKVFRQSAAELEQANREFRLAIKTEDERHLKTSLFFIQLSSQFQQAATEDLLLLKHLLVHHKSSGLCHRLR